MADKPTVTLLPRRDFLFRGQRYRGGSGPIQLQGTLEDRSIQNPIKKGMAVEQDADSTVSESAPVETTRLEVLASRFAVIADADPSLAREDGEHPISYLERMADALETAKSEREAEITPPAFTPPVVTTHVEGASTSGGEGTPPDVGMTMEEFTQKLRDALQADDVVAALIQKGVTNAQKLRETSDADLKAIPNLGDARLAKLREAFPNA